MSRGADVGITLRERAHRNAPRHQPIGYDRRLRARRHDILDYRNIRTWPYRARWQPASDASSDQLSDNPIVRVNGPTPCK